MSGLEPFLVAASLLVLLAVLASKVSSRLGVPALLLFLLIGMVAGSEGLGRIDFTDYQLAQNIGVVALAYILFAGGLSTQWDDVKRVVGPAAGLATAGVAVTAAVTGTAAAWVLDVPWTTGLLLGAIVSSTDAAAVFSVLRSRSVSLRGEIRPLLELESGSNDPMAVFLTVALIELISRPELGVVALVPVFLLQAVVGTVVGVVAAKLTLLLLTRLRLEYDGLYPVVSLAVVVLTFAVAAALGGSGFLAVYLCGILLGRTEFLHKKSLTRFHDAIAWLGQISMFLVLGLLVFPSALLSVAVPALVVAAVVVVVARPVAVFLALAVSRFNVREKAMISWVGLRGAVPIILATFPLVDGIPDSELIFDVVFFAVLLSVLVQGTTIPGVARRLGVDAPLIERPPYPLEAVSTGHGGATLHELVVDADSPADGSSLIELELPDGTLVVLISRDGAFVVPQGSTLLQAEDTVLVLADEAALPLVLTRFKGS